MARFVVHVFAGDGERVEGTVQREGAGPPAVYCGWLELLRILEPPRGVDGFADEREATGEASCGSSQELGKPVVPVAATEQADVVQASLGEDERRR